MKLMMTAQLPVSLFLLLTYSALSECEHALLFWRLVPLLKLKPLTPARLQFSLAPHQVWEPRRLLHWCTLCWWAGLKLPYCSLRFWLKLLRCEATLSPKDDRYGARALFIERNAQKHNPYINCKCKQCEERDYFIIKSCYWQIWKTRVGFCQKQHKCNFVGQVLRSQSDVLLHNPNSEKAGIWSKMWIKNRKQSFANLINIYFIC